MIEWKDIKGYEGSYQISKCGKVRSLDRYVKCRNGSALRKSQEIKSFVNPSGYLTTRICNNGKSKTVFIHKLIAEAFVDNENSYTEVNHIDHNKLNNDISNLEWCNRQYNMKAMVDFYGIKRKEKCCKECDKVISFDASYCTECLSFNRRKVERPDKETLLNEIKTYSILALSKKYLVSDNAIRKWLKSYQLPYRRADIANL